MTKMSRRELLRLLGMSGAMAPLASNPVLLLLESILHTFGNPALAEELEGNEKYYMGLLLRGGPPRYFFDLPLIVDPSCDVLSPNAGVITRFAQNNTATGGELIGEYATIDYKGIHLPWMWNQNVPTPGGGDVPMTNIVDNALFLRGLETFNGHALASNSMVQPLPGGVSVQSILQVNSKLPIAAVELNSGVPFVSTNGASVLSCIVKYPEYINPLKSLLEAFNLENPEGFIKEIPGESKMEKALDEVLDLLSHNIKNSSVKTKSLYQDRKNAKKLFKQGVESLLDLFDPLYQKYGDLIKISAQTNALEMLDDKPVIAPEIGDKMWTMTERNTYVQPGFDLRDAFSKSYNNAVARCFAIAEILFSQNLSSSFTGSASGFQAYTPAVDANGKLLGNQKIGADPHYGGAVPALLEFTRSYKGICACINEFRSAMTKIGKWDKTLIHIPGDFNRCPRFDGSGSDHFGPGSNVTLFSGMIKKPMLIGNCVIGSPTKEAGSDKFLTYPGDMGLAAPIAALGDRTPSQRNVASTIAELLDAESPTPGDSSLVKVVRGEIIPIAEAENITHEENEEAKVCKSKA